MCFHDTCQQGRCFQPASYCLDSFFQVTGACPHLGQNLLKLGLCFSIEVGIRQHLLKNLHGLDGRDV